jgi:signal transduction histidine kinase
LQHSWIRSAASVRLALVALIALVSVAGYVVTRDTIQGDRKGAAEREAQIESVRTQALLDRARAYVLGLGNVLGDEPVPSQRRFVELVGSTAGSAGLADALWVQNVPGADRSAYERSIGAPIERLTPSGRFVAAPPQASYLAATFTSRTRPELRRGVDVSMWPSLATAIRDPATVLAVTASALGSLGGEPGLYLVMGARFGRGADTAGYLAVFVSRGWLRLSLEDDPQQVAISFDGRQLEGQLDRAPAAVGSFDALARTWRIEVATAPASGLQSLLPWLVLAWPLTASLVALLVGNAVLRRRRAEREVESSRDALQVLADEQAALQRVATLVARGVSSDEVFRAVVGEMRLLLAADVTALERYEPDESTTIVAAEHAPGLALPLRAGMALEDASIADVVKRRGGAARIDADDGDRGSSLRRYGLGTAVAAPILVEGRLWGVIVAAWRRKPDVPASEQRITQFTELVATAIANAQSQAELIASRARVVAAGDETRRRIERDLHDGTQQRLVSLALGLRAAETKIPPELGDVRTELSQTAAGLAAALADLQEISRGIHPGVLSNGGLGVALKSLARRAGLPVELEVDVPGRLPPSVEVAAYYVVSEALTNAAKHAAASVVQVELKAEDDRLKLLIRDDGVGGADPERGSGLLGLRDRIEALGGAIEISSRRGRGTSLAINIPIDRSGMPAR